MHHVMHCGICGLGIGMIFHVVSMHTYALSSVLDVRWTPIPLALSPLSL